MSLFSDPETVARYAEGPVRQVPGFHGLQWMTGPLLAERVRDDGHVIVHGAGGGLELKAFAETQPGWHFCGVDPSAEMLGLAEHTLGPFASRVDFHLGYIDSAPAGASNAQSAITAISERLPLLSPEEDEAILRDAGFTECGLFYAGFTFRGWVGYKA